MNVILLTADHISMYTTMSSNQIFQMWESLHRSVNLFGNTQEGIGSLITPFSLTTHKNPLKAISFTVRIAFVQSLDKRLCSVGPILICAHLICTSALFLGLEMTWVQRPPEKIVSGVSFDVIYAVFASDQFYHYAVENGLLSHR